MKLQDVLHDLSVMGPFARADVNRNIMVPFINSHGRARVRRRSPVPWRGSLLSRDMNDTPLSSASLEKKT